MLFLPKSRHLLIPFLFLLFLLLSFGFLLTKEAKAALCGGSTKCCTFWETVCRGPLGNRTCTTTCEDTVTDTCQYSSGKCGPICDVGDVLSDDCYKKSTPKPTPTSTPTPTPTPKPEEKDCTWTGWKATGECCDRAGKEREKRYCKDSSGNVIRTDSRCQLRNDDCKEKEPVPTPTPTSPSVTECTPGTWSAERCATCNNQGYWNQDCSDFGPWGPTWCACDLKCPQPDNPNCQATPTPARCVIDDYQGQCPPTYVLRGGCCVCP